MTATKLTKTDSEVFNRVIARIAALRKDTEERFPEYKSSEWQFLYTVATKDITPGRINRLVTLGLLETKPSDGFGPSIRINPEYRRHL